MMQLKIRQFSQGDLTLYISYRRAFDVAIRELGIVNRPVTVNLFIRPTQKPKFIREESFTLWKIPVPTMKTVLMSLQEGGTAPKLNPDGSIDVSLSPRASSNAGYKMQTFMHEMVHVAQIIEGRLTGDPINGSVWEGQFFSPEEMKKLEHDELPWEKEANRKAAEIMKGPVTSDMKSFHAYLDSIGAEGVRQYLQEEIYGGIGGPLSAALGQENQAG